eukprot:PhF_6_TR11250/c1_g1_i1/m.18148
MSGNTQSLLVAACRVLLCPSLDEKVTLTNHFSEEWKNGRLSYRTTPEELSQLVIPTHPAREGLNVVAPGRAPRRKTVAAILHSLCNTEGWAIDLSWDVMVRAILLRPNVLPPEFFSDWIEVACDEARHYHMLKTHLAEIGTTFGSIPVHEGLWESA